MSHKYLGESFDIHGGGFDLIFPHHENEIAQSEALFGAPMARYWMHNGFITVNEEKMSKSLGNFFLVRDITAKFSPQVVRFYLLSTHYRSPLDFDDGKLEIAGKGLERLQTAYRLFKEYKSTATTGIERKTEAENYIQEVKGLHKRFLEAMNDDFNTALAIAVLFDLARAMNGFMSKGIEGNEAYKALMESAQIYEEMAKVLGIELESAVEQKDSGLVDGLMDLIIKVRQEARAKKDFATADAIRQGLKEIGIILEDTPQGVRWRYKSKGD
jgi:cysteinyl-tRNA synthetase